MPVLGDPGLLAGSHKAPEASERGQQAGGPYQPPHVLKLLLTLAPKGLQASVTPVTQNQPGRRPLCGRG